MMLLCFWLCWRIWCIAISRAQLPDLETLQVQMQKSAVCVFCFQSCIQFWAHLGVTCLNWMNVQVDLANLQMWNFLHFALLCDCVSSATGICYDLQSLLTKCRFELGLSEKLGFPKKKKNRARVSLNGLNTPRKVLLALTLQAHPRTGNNFWIQIH